MRKLNWFTLISLVVGLVNLASCGSGEVSKNTDTTAVKKEANVSTKETAVNLSPKEQKELNTFFSNFSEVFMEPFTAEGLTDKALINFGIHHNYLNNNKLFEKAGEGKVKIKELKVALTVEHYFEKVVKHQAIEGAEYKDGYYYIDDAAGETHQFSQVEKLMDLGNDKFVAYVNVYSVGSGWTGNPHGTPAEWKKTGEDVPEPEKYKATISKVTSEDKVSRYVLRDYTKLSK